MVRRNWVAALLLVAAAVRAEAPTAAAKGPLDCAVAPLLPGYPYPTVRAGDETTLTLLFYPEEFAGDPLAARLEPTLPAEVWFTDEDGHGRTTVRAPLERVGPGEWRAVFVLPHQGRWEGRGTCSPAFALRAAPSDRAPEQLLGPRVPAAAVLAVAVVALGALLLRR